MEGVGAGIVLVFVLLKALLKPRYKDPGHLWSQSEGCGRHESRTGILGLQALRLFFPPPCSFPDPSGMQFHSTILSSLLPPHAKTTPSRLFAFKYN